MIPRRIKFVREFVRRIDIKQQFMLIPVGIFNSYGDI